MFLETALEIFLERRWATMTHKFLRGTAIMLVFVFMFTTLVFASPFHHAFPNHQIAAPPLQGWSSDMLNHRELFGRQEGLDIRGTVPRISMVFDSASLINSHIDDYIVTSLVAEARRLRARSITFYFEFHTTDDVISLVIFADVATTLPHTLVRSVNFCTYTGSIFNMNEAMDMAITPLAERILAEIIRANPERYYAALSSNIPEAFFLTRNRLVILFDGFRLSTQVATESTIELTRRNIRSTSLRINEYRPDGPYGLKMIPLRYVLADRLDYDVRWYDYETGRRRIVISRNEIDLIELSPDDNEYIVHGTQRRSLEVAPQIFVDEFTGEERTYVPITFFDQILPLTTYTIDRNGRITFLAYLPE
jgi:hypothetical protein